jgi:peptidyl-tRNA hydrolase
MRLFEKHGMQNVAYWVPTDEKLKDNTLIYIVAHASHDAAKKSWDNFINDPEWKAARDESEKDGKIVAKVDRVYMMLTDYSPAHK